MGFVRSLPSSGPTKMPSFLMAAPFARLRALQASYGRGEASVSPKRPNAGPIDPSECVEGVFSEIELPLYGVLRRWVLGWSYSCMTDSAGWAVVIGSAW